jgi:hypothetical protein
MNTAHTLTESYQQSVYHTAHAILNRLIQQVQNQMPTYVISMEAAALGNDIFLDNLTTEVVVEVPGFRSTDPDIPIANNCKIVELHWWIPGVSQDHKEDGDSCELGNAIPTARRQQQPATERERFCLGTRGVMG